MKFITAIVNLSFLVFMLVGAASATTLKDTLRLAYYDSGLIEQNRALLRAADEDVATAVSALNPIVNFSSQYAHNSADVLTAKDTLTLNISAQWLLFDFGRTHLQVEGLKETVLSTRYSLISIEQTVLLRAATAHLNHRRNAEIVAVRTTNVELIEKELKAAKDRFEVGQITRTDVALAEARLASAKASLASAKGDHLRSAAEYIAAVGQSPNNLQTPASLPNLPASTEVAIARARALHPDLKQVQHAVKVAEIGVQVAGKAYDPSITGALNLSTSDTNNWGSINQNASITAETTFFNGGKNEAAIRKAIALRDSSRGQLHVTSLAIDQNVRNAFAQRDVASASRVATEQQVEASTVAFNGVSEEAAVGSRTTLEVLNAEQELLTAKNSRISAVIDEQIASFSVLSAIGELTADKLKLGVKTYDPTEYYDLVKGAPNMFNSSKISEIDHLIKSVSGQ